MEMIGTPITRSDPPVIVAATETLVQFDEPPQFPTEVADLAESDIRWELDLGSDSATDVIARCELAEQLLWVSTQGCLVADDDDETLAGVGHSRPAYAEAIESTRNRIGLRIDVKGVTSIAQVVGFVASLEAELTAASIEQARLSRV